MSTRDQKIKKAYGKSKFYDWIMNDKLWWGRVYSRIIWGFQDMHYVQSVLKFIPDDFAGKLLDVPVGTASFTYRKYKVIPNAEISVLDYSEDMLALAKQRFTENNSKNVTCMQGDVGNLQFESETFDIVLSMNGFHAFPDKNRAFTETARVLKVGGVFCGCFYIKGEKRLTDWFIKTFFVSKGWFTPPFYSKLELTMLLKEYYRTVEVYNQKSMFYYKCVK